ncbi:3'-5' exonuclease [Algicola sagamiensis]|uniref:3'-5' exonuclease n=1 Tax=Algicola sagamiensis TaxID=163869 RepID=UPI00037D6235|nr:3'-5' exonuclease [Algicola sagamiensis]
MKTLNELKISPLVAVVDIETLSTQPNAAIVSIGCVIVNLFTQETVDEFYRVTDTYYQAIYNRDAMPSTVRWWEEQKETNPAAWKEYEKSNSIKESGQFELALIEFNNFLIKHFVDPSTIQLMGNGCDFDNVILQTAFKKVLFSPSWEFSGNQSLRTAVWLGRLILGIDPKYDIPFEGTKHHALHDARHEAKVLLNIFHAFLCLEKPTPTWEEAPDNFKWRARNADGSWLYFMNKPQRYGLVWRDGGDMVFGSPSTQLKPTPGWEFSLEQRPEVAA